MSERPVRVLVVDDSAVVRQTLLRLLSGASGFEVTVAADAAIATRRLSQRRPDVIVLDLNLPGEDGLSFLRRIMAADPIPVVVCSAFADHSGRAAMEALEGGAVDLITKPALDVRGFLEEQALTICDTLRAAARARVGEGPAADRHDTGGLREVADVPGLDRLPIVAIGASTGGTQALRTILAAMPVASPPLVVVQHMPAGYTRAFAERLDQECAIEVREARHGDRVQPGRALIAPGDQHLRLLADGPEYRAQLHKGALVSRHRPSVDVLFHSVAQLAGSNAVGVLLTGMGVDGAEGLLALKRAGARTIAQDETTSVVFGMPKEAARLGATTVVLPLPAIAAAILARAPALVRG